MTSNWKIILPDPQETNIVTNPSVETNTTGYTAVGGSIARVATAQRRGAFSLAVTPTAGVNDGVFYGTVTLVNGTTYCFDIDVLGVNGVPYQIYFASTVPATLGTPTTFTGTGQWQRVRVFWAENVGAARRLYITKNNNASTGVFNVDGLKCSARTTESTYFDGDSVGWTAGDFYWLGTPHASQSVRKALIRAGGRVTDFETEYSFVVTEYRGTGLNKSLNILLAMALLGGATYQRSVPADHVFSLVGYFNGQSQQDLQRKRKALIDGVKPDAAIIQQPLLLRYQAALPGQTAYGLELDIPAVFDAGLESGPRAGFTETAALIFHTYLPYVTREQGNAGASLTVSVANTWNYLTKRNPDGSWSNLGTAPSSQILCIFVSPSTGLVYIGGGFTSIGGVTTNAIAVYNPATGTISALGTGGAASAVVNAINEDANGNIYVAGTFTGMGGVATTANAAMWNGAWNSITGGLLASTPGIIQIGITDVNVLVFMYGGGGYLSWNGSVLTTGATNAGFDAIRGLDGNMYYGGTDGVYRTGDLIGSFTKVLAADGNVFQIRQGPDGTFTVIGNFSTLGGVTVTRIANWTGQTNAGVSSMSSGLGTAMTSPPGTSLLFDNVGDVYVGAASNATFGSLTLPGSIGEWLGSTWVPVGLVLTGRINALALAKDGTLYVGHAFAGALTYSAVTTVTNLGTQQTYPRITINGPSSPISTSPSMIVNTTTGKAIYFNLNLLQGEQAVLDLTPGAITFTSSLRGNILNTILPGSDLSTFSLIPGTNSIAVLSPSAASVLMTWPVVHYSIDGGAN